MKNFPSLLFFQFYRYSDELIEQSELERVFTMSTTKGATQDLTFTTATNVTGSTFCTGRIVRFPRRQDPQTLIQQGGICCPFAENFSLTVKLPLSPMNSTQFRSSRTFRQKQIPSSSTRRALGQPRSDIGRENSSQKTKQVPFPGDTGLAWQNSPYEAPVGDADPERDQDCAKPAL